MPRYKLVLSYDGTRYSGWQKQPGKTTIQGTVEAALSRLFDEETTVTGSGRTDAGVHALGQVAHVDLGISLAPSNLLVALNSQLPPDIRILQVERVPTTFHARYSARQRAYVYLIRLVFEPSPFFIHHSLQVTPPLDIKAMNAAAMMLTGAHNFSAFRSSGGGHTLPTRTVFKSEVFTISENLVCYLIVADAFLRKMVRGIVGTLLEIGKEKATPDIITRLLISMDRSLMGPLAPPQGLYLTAVSYPDESFIKGDDPFG